MSDSKPFTFADIVDLQDTLSASDPRFKKMTLPEFSAFAQQATGENYSAGMHDSAIKRFSVGVDKVLKPAADLGQYIGHGIGSMVTDNPRYQEMAGDIGRGVPRGIATVASAAAGGPVGIGMAALLGGSEAYTSTDSLVAGGIGAISAGMFPQVQAAGRALGVKGAEMLTKTGVASKIGANAVEDLVPNALANRLGETTTGVLQRGVEAGGEMLGFMVQQEATMQATDAALGTQTPLDEHLISLFGSQIPFLALGAKHVLQGPSIGKLNAKVDFPSFTDKKAAETIALHQQAKAVYDAADVEARMNNTQRLSWEPVMDTTVAPARNTGFVSMGGVTVPEGVVGAYTHMLNMVGEKGTSVSAKEFASKYKVSMDVANEVVGLMEKRGLVGPDTGTGERPVVAQHDAPSGELIADALAMHPETVNVVLKPKAVQEELPGTTVTGEVKPSGDASMHPEEQRLRDQIDTMTKAGVDNNSPEMKTVKQQLLDVQKSVSKGEDVKPYAGKLVSLEDTIIGHLSKDEFKNDSAIQLALDQFKNRGAAPETGGPVSSLIDKIVLDPDNTTGMTLTQRALYYARKTQDSGGPAPESFLSSLPGNQTGRAKRFVVGTVQSTIDPYIKRGSKMIQLDTLEDLQQFMGNRGITDKGLIKAQLEANGLDAAYIAEANLLVATDKSIITGKLPDKVGSHIAKNPEPDRTPITVDLSGKGELPALKPRGNESEQFQAQTAASLKDPNAFVKPTVKLTTDERLGLAQQLAANLQTLIKNALIGDGPVDQRAHEALLSNELQVHVDQARLTEFINSRLEMGENSADAASKAYNSVMYVISERVDRAFRLKAIELAKTEAAKTDTAKPDPKVQREIDRTMERINSNEIPVSALKIIVDANRYTSQVLPGDVTNFAYMWGVKAWEKLGSPTEEVLRKDPELMLKLREDATKPPGFYRKAYGQWERKLTGGKTLHSLDELTTEGINVKHQQGGDSMGDVESTAFDIVEGGARRTPEDEAMLASLSKELFSAPEWLSTEKWTELAREGGVLEKRAVNSNMVSGLNAIISTLQNGYLSVKAFGGRLTLKLVDQDGFSVKDLAAQAGFMDDVPGFKKFVENHANKYLQAYMQKYAPESTAIAMKNMAEAIKRDETRLQAKVVEDQKAMSFEGSRPGDQAGLKPEDVGLDSKLAAESTNPFNMQAGVFKFFNKYFSERGYVGAEAAGMSDLAVRMASMFRNVETGRIGELLSESTDAGGHMWPKSDNAARFVGLVVNPNTMAHLPGFDKFWMHSILGHELWHMTSNAVADGHGSALDSARFMEIRKTISDLTPEERSTMVGEWVKRMLPESYMKDRQISDWVSKRQAAAFESEEEMLADYAGFLVTGLASNKSSKLEYMHDAVKFSSIAEQDFANSLYIKMSDLTDSLEHYFNTSEVAKADGTRKLGTVFKDMHGKVMDALQNVKEAQKAMEQFKRIQQFDPKGFVKLLEQNSIEPVDVRVFEAFRAGDFSRHDATRVGDMVRAAGEFLGVGKSKEVEDAFGQQPASFEKILFPAAQLAERYPLLKPALNLAMTFRGKANDITEKILMPFLGRTKTIFGKETSRMTIDVEANGLKLVLSNEEANKAASKIALRENEIERVLTDGEMRSMMPGLGRDTQQAVIDFHRAVEQSEEKIAQVRLKSEAESTVNKTVRMLQLKNKDLTAAEATALGKEIAIYSYKLMGRNPGVAIEDLINSVPQLDPSMAQMKWQELQTRAGGSGPFLAAQRTALTRWSSYAKLEAMLYNGNGTHKNWYQSEVRLGQYFVSWKDAKGEYVDARGFDNAKEAAMFKAKLENQGYEVRATDKYEQSEHLSGMDARLVKAYSEQERADLQNALELLGQNTNDFEAFKEFSDSLAKVYTPGAGSEKLMQSKGYGKYGLHAKRKGGPEGRDTINMPQGFFEQVQSMTTGLSRARTKELATIQLDDPSMRANPALQNYAADHLQMVLNPPGREWVTTKNLIFNQFLGFNLSSMLIERSQSILTVAPQLVRDGAGIGESYRLLYRGATEPQSKSGVYLDPVIERAVQKAYKNQVIDFGLAQELHNQEDVSIHNIRALAQGGELTKVADFLTRPIKQYAQLSRSLYANSTKWNAKMTFVAGMKFATENLKMSPDAAYDYAAGLVRSTNYSGGAAARPGLFHNLGKTHGAVGAMYALQSYTFSAISQMARYGLDSISKSVPEAQRPAARKALGQMVLTQFALTGAMGMPLAGGMLAMIDSLFPNLEAKKNIKETLAKMFTDDEKTGSVIADIAMNGFANQSGIDFGSRVGLGNWLGVSSYDGLNAKNLLGPGYSMAASAVQGVQELSEGKYGKAAETMLPNAYKNMVKLHNDEYDFRDERGRLMFEGTTPEKILYAAGLKTTKLSQMREEQQLVRNSDDVAKRELLQFHTKVADVMQTGDVEKTREMLLQRQQSDSMYDARAGARLVVQMLQDRAIPLDPSRNGVKDNAVERSRIAAMYGQKNQPTEVQRLMQAKQLEQTLQLPGLGKVSRAEMTHAQMVDRVMQMYPGINRQMALQVVNQTRHPVAGQPQLQAGL